MLPIKNTDETNVSNWILKRKTGFTLFNGPILYPVPLYVVIHFMGDQNVTKEVLA